MQNSMSIDEITEMLAESTVSKIRKDYRQISHKASPLMKLSQCETQEERRKRALEEQQKRRRDFTDHARNLALYRPSETSSDEDLEDVSTPVETSESQEMMDHEMIQFYNYRNQIMYAECMEDIPNDLEVNWYVVMCPAGKRRLVITSKGKTVSRSRSGHVISVFESVLPAGSSVYKGNKTNDYCILDCIFDETSSTYYILDLIFYWLHSKFAEIDDSASTNTSITPTVTFKPLTIHYCSREQLSTIMSDLGQFGYQPDGLLFFNKKTQYVIGDTPLCGWVALGKIFEVFGDLGVPLLNNEL
ncbi:2168_t:CDS:2 [Ambispora gerdemannii]|uniref:Snurportin-1 n=1 Tax=Ambispora gerdemannii TaxID=144530 RepID=A0A9N8WSS5_9GLOM|nr:2168_t:CDS:2 [Ambispora gerdemannii]